MKRAGCSDIYLLLVMCSMYVTLTTMPADVYALKFISHIRVSLSKKDLIIFHSIALYFTNLEFQKETLTISYIYDRHRDQMDSNLNYLNSC